MQRGQVQTPAPAPAGCVTLSKALPLRATASPLYDGDRLPWVRDGAALLTHHRGPGQVTPAPRGLDAPGWDHALALNTSQESY